MIQGVLCISNFKFNLSFVSKIAKYLKCCVSFFSDYLIFRDLLTGKVKEIGREEECLYVLSSPITADSVNNVKIMGGLKDTTSADIFGIREWVMLQCQYLGK